MKGVYSAWLMCCFLGLVGSSTSGQTIRTVALTGQQAPGTSSSASYSQFEAPVLNSDGHVAFLATVEAGDVDTSNDRGIWSEGAGLLDLIARTSSHAPGTPDGTTYRFLGDPLLNSAGQTIFYGSLVGGDASLINFGGIWSESNGTQSLVARGGEPAPGVDDEATFYKFGYHLFNDAGQTAFQGALTGGDVRFPGDRGVWSGDAGSLALVAHSDDHVPGAPIGTNFGINRLGVARGLSLNIAGDVAFHAFLTGPDVDTMNNEGIWLEAGDTSGLVVRKGDRAPGTSDGVTYSAFSRDLIALNAAGRTAFGGFLTGPGIDLSNDAGVWSEGSGALDLIAREGDQVPGAPNGAAFQRFEDPIMNSAGQTVFHSTWSTRSGNVINYSEGIFSSSGGSLSLVARTSDPAPGTSNGVNFDRLDKPALNSTGQVAFYALLSGTDTNITNSAGIWAEDTSGRLQLIARTGDPLEVTSGEFRTIESLWFLKDTGNGDGRRSGFNDWGQLAFRATFTDGSSGIFVSNRVAVPEPAGVVLVGTGLLLLAIPCRQHRFE